jgi:hypothetical protein
MKKSVSAAKFIEHTTTMSLSKTIKTNIRSPWQGGGLWPNPERDKVYWVIWCDYCGKKIIQWNDNREDLKMVDIMRYGEQEIEDERGRIRVCSANGRLPLFPDVYRLRNSNRDLCKSCYEERNSYS